MTGHAEGADRYLSGTRVCQYLGNSSDFHFGVFALNFQLLLRAPWEGGAHVVRAATQIQLAQRSEARADLF
jgi:hypothetical protein